MFDSDSRAGGMMRSQIPKFRLPDEVIDEEVGYALSTGGQFVAERRIDSLKGLIGEGYDAIFVGCGAPRGRNLDIPGRREAASHIHIGIDWLASVSFGHISSIGRRVVVLGRRQHRDGLLPDGAAPRRRRGQGRRALRLRRDEGFALGEGRRDARGRRDPELPRAQGVHA